MRFSQLSPQHACLMLVSLVIAGCATTTANTSTQQSIKAACEGLVLDYAYYRDREDAQTAAQGVAGVFTEDATLTVNGQTFSGRQAIFDRLFNSMGPQDNPPLTAHMMSTIRIFPTSATAATGVSYATVYIAPRPASGGVLAEGFTAVGEYHDEFTLTADGWRIAKRTYIARIRHKSTNP